MKTSELQGAALDWAVAKCEGYTDLHKIAGRMPHEPQLGIWPPRKEYGAMDLLELSFSTDWAQGGPIIEREEISLEREQYSFEWCAYRPEYPEDRAFVDYGPTPLVAAMRCYVALKLGEEIEVPNELIETINT